MNQKPALPDNKNFFLAIALSVAIIFGWQYLFPTKPTVPAQQQTTTQQGTTQTGGQTGGQTAATPAAGAPGAVVELDAALAQSSRIPVETAALSGSINLTGAQFDDLKLNTYRETVDPKSPTIRFLSPSGTPNAYFVEQGVLAAPGQTLKLPDSKTVWTAPAGAKLTETTPVVLTWDNGEGLTFRREISISDIYVINVRQIVENHMATPAYLLPYARVQRQDTPHVAGNWVFFEGALGVQNGKLTETHYKDLAKEGGKLELPSTGGWLGFTDKYWATALIPSQSAEMTQTFQHFKTGDRDSYQVDYRSTQPVTVAPGASAVLEDHVYAGAKVVEIIKTVGEKLKVEKFDLMIDWGWFGPLTRAMYWLLEHAKGLLGNFGLAILGVTVLVKLLLFPLANRSYASMSKMKKLQPQMEAIKKQYPEDRMKQQQEVMELYKREKVSPVSGCLPILIQIPIFFALYKVIFTTIELRHAPFYGWIHDLSAPDPTSLFNLFGLIPITLPHMLMIGVWPILMGITMWVQMRLNPAPTDPVQASMFNWMPLLFTFMLSSMPVGLVIYWTWSNLLSIIQQSYIMKKNGAEVNILGNIRDSLPFLKKKAAS